MIAEDERPWPWPRALTGNLLAGLLGVPLQQNRQLRRKLHAALARLGPEWWPVHGVEDSGYDEALVTLLRQQGGYRRYLEAIKRDQQLASSQERLNPSSAIAKHVRGLLRKAGAAGQIEGPDNVNWAQFTEKNLAAEAAMLAWSIGINSDDPRLTIASILKENPSLEEQIEGLDATGKDAVGATGTDPGASQPSDDNLHVSKDVRETVDGLRASIAAMLPNFGGSTSPDASAAAQLRDLAARLANLLAAEAEMEVQRRAQAVEALHVEARNAACAILRLFPLPQMAIDADDDDLANRLAAAVGDATILRDLTELAEAAGIAAGARDSAKKAFDEAYAAPGARTLEAMFADATAARKTAVQASQAVEDMLNALLGTSSEGLDEPAPRLVSLLSKSIESIEPLQTRQPATCEILSKAPTSDQVSLVDYVAPPDIAPPTPSEAFDEPTDTAASEYSTATGEAVVDLHDQGKHEGPPLEETVPKSPAHPRTKDVGGGLGEQPFRAPESTPATPLPGSAASAHGLGASLAIDLTGWPVHRDALNRLYWIVRAAEAGGADGPPLGLPVAAAVRAFLLGLALLSGEVDVASDMEASAATVVDSAGASNLPENLALLLPAAIASQQIGHQILPFLQSQAASTPLAIVADAVGSWVRAGTELRAPLLEALRSHDTRENHVAALRTAAGQWLDAARQRRGLYQPATRVWQDWLADGGPIGAVMRDLFGGNLTVAEAEQATDLWRNVDRVREQIDLADRRLRAHFAETAPIQGTAASVLVRHAAEAAEFFGQAASLLGGTRSDPAGASRLRSLREAAHAAAAAATARSGPLLAVALDGLLAATSGAVRRRIDVKLELAEPLLLCPDLRLDVALQPQTSLPQVDTLRAMLADPWDPATAALRRAERGEAAAVEATLRLLEAGSTSSQVVQDCRDACHAKLDTWTADVARRRRALERRLERDRWLDLLSAETALEIEQRLEMARPDAGDDAVALASTLDEAETLLQRGEDTFATVLRERRHRLESTPNITPQLLDLVDRAITTSDLERADEHLRRLEGGMPVPTAAEAIKLPLQAFETFLADLASPPTGLLAQRISTETIVKNLSQRITAAGPPIELVSVRPALDAWRTAQGRNGFVREEVRDILLFLGFGGIKSIQQVGTGQHFRLHVQAFDSISDCPLWQFGSGAAGRYEILGLDPLPQSAERLLRRVEEAGIAEDTPLIVLCARPIPDALRKSLLRLLARRQRRMLVLDESLLLFMATQPTPRVATFFRCALPWSGLQPYIIRSGVTLPPELFVGRLEERRELESPSGACLVYGGRQLGKTALLREMERAHRTQENDRITMWIDLASLGIEPDGGRPLSAIWEEIGQRLGARGIREANLGQPQLRTGVEKWLRERRGAGRVLVLLDEADDFIEADSRTDFQQLRLMKGLMDQTEQRFKVIFTGLHNVQRASHQVNTPLAHLGNPICIGPLHGHAEAEEAWRLITDPFAARGFAFDPPDLPLAILAQANYYPSLIQLICYRLIEQLDSRGRVPPAHITEDEVREVLDSRELRRQLQERFLRTLGLDPRYHLFALCLAYHALQNPSDKRVIDGFEPGWFASQALEYWPEGFPDGVPPTAARALLEEMVGLGVLAETPSGRFLLRSPNLRPLLGDRAQVDEGLAAFIGRPPPRPFPPGTFRRRLGDDAGDPRRSPLSMADEGMVFTRDHGVLVVSGLELAGIGRLRIALERALPPHGARIWADEFSGRAVDEPELRRIVQSIAKRAVSGSNVLIIDGEVGWAPELPIAVARMLDERRERDRVIRIVFVADGRSAWRWREATETRGAEPPTARIREIALTPWTADTVRRWIDETGASAARDEAERQALWDACGGFGPALELLAIGDHPHHPSRFAEEVVARLTVEGREPLGDWPASVHRALVSLTGLTWNHKPGQTSPSEEFDADLLAEAGDIPRQEAQKIIAWAEWLGAVTATLPGYYRLNPLVGRLLARPHL